MADTQSSITNQRKGVYVQYGCGAVAPEGWINFDASPSLRIQHLPIIGMLLRSKLPAIFPDAVKYGDISIGLPGIAPSSCDGIYCSHVLEHLALEDFRSALKNSYSILKPGGLFRCIVPDLEASINWYLESRKAGDEKASIKFIGTNTIMGTEQNPKSLTGKIRAMYANSYFIE